MSQNLIKKENIPEYVTRVTQTLAEAGFEAFIVGGCVRDLIIGRVPKDWDVTTNANPQQIQGLFEKTIYENKFGTVGVVIKPTSPQTPLLKMRGEETLPSLGEGLGEVRGEVVEVTPYRTEAKYSDFRHPDEVKFSDNIEDDLKRRDFTMNAMAYSPITDILIDNYNGQSDIKDMIIKTVGGADDRFKEDALRMLRAVRFACELSFTVSYETMTAIIENSPIIDKVSRERIRDEFVKIINSPNPVVGIGMLQKFGLLKYIIPELEEGIGCEQGGAHAFDVFTHCVQALGHAAEKGWDLEIRLSALFHDIGKPRSRRVVNAMPLSKKSGPRVKSPDHDFSQSGSASKRPYTFYGHEVIGARMAQKIMERLKFSRETSEKVVKLVRYHMFFSDTEAITLSAVRRIIVNVTRENIWDLMNIRECDRVGMKKAEAPYRLRKYHAMIEECLRDPISVSQLKVDGNILMKELGIKPGPRMGNILNALLEEVLDDPTKNDRTYLDVRVAELNDLSDSALRSLADKAKNTKEKLEEREVQQLHKKHGV